LSIGIVGLHKLDRLCDNFSFFSVYQQFVSYNLVPLLYGIQEVSSPQHCV